MEHEKHFSLVGTATVGPKGQVVIPVEVRESLSIKTGDKLVVLRVHGKDAVVFITESQAQVMVDHLGKQVDGLRSALEDNK
jgi:AbrB family looped-hinge helix DNA binding protein